MTPDTFALLHTVASLGVGLLIGSGTTFLLAGGE